MAKTIADYKKDYAAAAARGDAAGMKAANDGANAIRAASGQAEQKATSDIGKVASGGTSGMVSNPGRYDDGGYSSGRTSGSSSGGGTSRPSSSSSSGSSSSSSSSSSGYRPYVKGENSALDNQLAVWGQRYNEARERALAGDQRAVMDMRNANDEANKLRNAYGYAAVFAHDDINSVKDQINYYGGGGSGSSGGTGSYPAPSKGENLSMSGTDTAVNDLSAYLEDLYAAQRRQTLANLNNAYQQNVNAISRAGEGVDTRYQSARNQAAGASELAARNFAEYAAASGLNSGAGGQAELARNVALQNNLSDIDLAESDTYANLELQKANAETEYNNAIAQAQASNDFALAESLYQEKIRAQQELVNRQMQQFQMDLQNRQLAFQQQQADTANQQWQQTFDYNSQQDAKNNLVSWGNQFLQNGMMPSQEMLEAMGLSAADAQAYLNRLSLMQSLSAAGQGRASYSSADAERSSPARTSSTPNIYVSGAPSSGPAMGGISSSIPRNLYSQIDLGAAPLPSIPSYVLSELSKLEDTGNATSKILSAIRGYVKSDAISEAQAKALGRKYGLEL